MVEKIDTINPQILKWARLISGVSLEDAGKTAGKIESIIMWEDGKDYPTYSQLKNLSNLYRKPVAVFFFPEPPNIKNLKTSYRTLPDSVFDSLSKQAIKAIDEARVMQLNLFELNKGINPSQIKVTDNILILDNIKNVAIELRKYLRIDIKTQKQIKKLEDAFELWRECFFKIGIYVFKNAFKDNTISGFCLYDKEFPVIYINNSLAISRQIFTLFHEIFHLLSSTSGIDFLKDDFIDLYNSYPNINLERICNRFAGEFLVPDDDFDILIKELIPSEEVISKLASSYCVSREVILRKFFNRNKITQEEYEEKRETYIQDYFRHKKKKSDGKKSSGGNYYNNQSVYKGKQYLKLVFEHYYSNDISINQLSRYMDMTIPSIRELASIKGWGTV